MTKPLLITNGYFYSGNGKVYSDTTMFVENGRIREYGNYFSLRLKSPDAQVIQVNGGAVLPGLVDSHIHIAQYARFLQSVDCEVNSKEAVLRRVSEKTRNSTQDWIIGYGWNQNNWSPREFGTKEELDAVSNGKIVVLNAKSLHACWVNSAALHAAGISRDTADPEGGTILRNEKGEPTGILLENAMGLIGRVRPAPDDKSQAKSIEEAQFKLFSMGVTGIHDFDRFESYRALRLLESEGKLKMRIAKNLPATAMDELLAKDYRKEMLSDKIHPGWVKGFADGALGPQSAAMLEPYEGTEDKGMLLLTRKQVLEMGKEAASAGWPLAIHAIGDAANREVIEGYGLLRKYEEEMGLPHLPHRIEHLQCVTPEDRAKLKTCNIVASVQPIHATSDMFAAEKLWGQRCDYAYSYRSFSELGIPNVYGSDAPVESPDPFLGLYAAIARRKTTGEPGPDGWHPEQRVKGSIALDGFSYTPNKLAGFNDQTGLEVGDRATMVIIDHSMVDLDPELIKSTKPALTIVDGEIVYSN